MCGCNQTKRVSNKPVNTYSSSGDFAKSVDLPEGADPASMVTLEYVGSVAETFSIRSRVDRGINYRFGNNQYHKERTVFLADAMILTQMTDRENKPLYRIKNAAISGTHDPTDIVGAIA